MSSVALNQHARVGKNLPGHRNAQVRGSDGRFFKLIPDMAVRVRRDFPGLLQSWVRGTDSKRFGYRLYACLESVQGSIGGSTNLLLDSSEEGLWLGWGNAAVLTNQARIRNQRTVLRSKKEGFGFTGTAGERSCVAWFVIGFGLGYNCHVENVGELSENAKESQQSRYLSTTYRNHAFSDYPSKLAEFLFRSLGLQGGSELLDVGAGRGELSVGFAEQGLRVTGIDQSPPSMRNSPLLKFQVADLEKPLPFADSSFDVVFSKSVIEHFYFPENLVHEMYRVLRPGGVVVSMTPSWIHNVKNFHIDFTHRTPFTRESLVDIHLIAGFDEVASDYFIQLPKVWLFPFLKYASAILGFVAPTFLSKYSKTIRFSKERMLIATAKKPLRH